ncbi:MAG: thioredoxin domain-containing protein [Candidatus Odinarchaeia archaeon]
MKRKSNHLINEPSPYLKQHAYDPVDWYPWCEEAFKKAQEEDKPILLSIGYSTCHWCHVMAEESFRDEKTAQYLNSNFVCIKVDREERPDLNAIYMKFIQRISGKAGWPLTVFLTSDGLPFYGGTYFPKTWKYGLSPFQDVIKTVKDAYDTKRSEILRIGKAVQKIIDGPRFPSVSEVTDQPVDYYLEAFSKFYDYTNGGISGSFKFPTCPLFISNINMGVHLDEVYHTLKKMGFGGICDHLGGGFHRYAVDSYWMVPHFEKMLYDNAQLLELYSKAYMNTKNPFFREKAESILNYVESTLSNGKGGYYSAQDSDTEGEEGKYYKFTYYEIVEAVGDNQPFFKYFNVYVKGSFEGDNILTINEGYQPTESEMKKIKEGIKRLRAYRDKRTQPEVDTKIVASWNAMMANGLIWFALATDKPQLIKKAEQTVSLLLKDGEIKRIVGGEIEGFLQDYASIASTLLTLYEVTSNQKYLEKSCKIIEEALNLFYEGDGVFGEARKKSERLFAKPYIIEDNATPSGVATMTLTLFKLNQISFSEKYENIITDVFKRNLNRLSAYPLSHPTLIQTLYYYMRSFYGIKIDGDTEYISHARKELLKTPVFNKIIYSSNGDKDVITLCAKGVCKEYETVEEVIKQILS